MNRLALLVLVAFITVRDVTGDYVIRKAPGHLYLVCDLYNRKSCLKFTRKDIHDLLPQAEAKLERLK